MPNQDKEIIKPIGIELAAVKALQSLLRAHSQDWGKLLADLMYPQTEAQKRRDKYNKKGTRKVYNIVANQIKNNADRVAFMLKGKELLDILKGEQEKAMLVVEEVNSQMAPVQ